LSPPVLEIIFTYSDRSHRCHHLQRRRCVCICLSCLPI